MKPTQREHWLQKFNDNKSLIKNLQEEQCTLFIKLNNPVYKNLCEIIPDALIQEIVEYIGIFCSWCACWYPKSLHCLDCSTKVQTYFSFTCSSPTVKLDKLCFDNQEYQEVWDYVVSYVTEKKMKMQNFENFKKSGTFQVVFSKHSKQVVISGNYNSGSYQGNLTVY